MEYRIKTSKAFDREIKRLSKRYHSMADDYERLLNEIEGNPHLGTDLGGGLRKIPHGHHVERAREKRRRTCHNIHSGGFGRRG